VNLISVPTDNYLSSGDIARLREAPPLLEREPQPERQPDNVDQAQAVSD
jgi:hypothetical protein